MSWVHLSAGRELLWAPAWPCAEERVLFDAASGDFWVLSTAGQTALVGLQAEGSLPRDLVLERLSAFGGDGSAVLDDLLQGGLVVVAAPGGSADGLG